MLVTFCVTFDFHINIDDESKIKARKVKTMSLGFGGWWYSEAPKDQLYLWQKSSRVDGARQSILYLVDYRREPIEQGNLLIFTGSGRSESPANIQLLSDIDPLICPFPLTHSGRLLIEED